MNKKLRRGAVHPETGWRFDGYNKLSKNGESWMPPDKYEKRCAMIRFYSKRARAKNRELFKRRQQEWRDSNRERYRALHRKASAKRRSDPVKRMACNLRTRLWCFFKLTKDILRHNVTIGCSKQELIAHVESLFQPGRNWDDYGSAPGCWSMDHTIPLSTATTIEELRPLVHFTNLAPMWHIENVRKNWRRPQTLTKG